MPQKWIGLFDVTELLLGPILWVFGCPTKCLLFWVDLHIPPPPNLHILWYAPSVVPWAITLHFLHSSRPIIDLKTFDIWFIVLPFLGCLDSLLSYWYCYTWKVVLSFTIITAYGPNHHFAKFLIVLCWLSKPGYELWNT